MSIDDPCQPDATIALVASCIRSLRLGEPLSGPGLALLPLYRDGESDAPPYRTLTDALAKRTIDIVEAPGASVPTLRVVNRDTLPVFILDGEEVVGGLQNRVANTSLLVPPTCEFDLPVSCVEQGRWRSVSPTFQAGETANPSLRGQKLLGVTASYQRVGRPQANQQAVWDEVAALHRRARTASETGALHDAFVGRRDDLAQAELAFRRPPDRAIGILAVIGGLPRWADIFDRPETLRTYWPRLVRSYALEGIGAFVQSVPLDPIHRFLDRAAAAHYTAFAAPGLGFDVRLRNRSIAGAALVYGGAVLHAALFGGQQEPFGRKQEPAESPLRPPSRRARRFDREA